MSEASEESEDIRDIQPDRLIKFRLSPDRFFAEVLMPGLWYTDFDKNGEKWSWYSVAKMTEFARLTGMMQGLFYFSDLKADNHALFLAINTISLTPAFHEITFGTHYAKHFPILFKLNIVHLGETSFTISTEMFDHVTGKELGSSLTKVVYVSLHYRRPQKLPDWFKIKSNCALKGREMTTVSRKDSMPIPPSAFHCRIKALHSDCDVNGHVNQSGMFKWCSDVGSLAAVRGHFSFFRKHIELYKTKHIEIRYLQEILADETADVYTWEDKDDATLLHFHIAKDGRPICIALIQFPYSDQIELSKKLATGKL